MSSLVLTGDTSGQVTLAAPAVAGSNTITLQAATATSSVNTLGTAVIASGTSVDFASIPSWVKRITVLFSGVSTSGTSKLLVRIGTGGVPTTSGYSSQTSALYTTIAFSSETTGFQIYYDTSTFVISGSMVLHNITGNTWVMNGGGGNPTTTAFTWTAGGTIALAGVLNFLRVTTLNGTDTFDAGTVNIFYEG